MAETQPLLTPLLSNGHVIESSHHGEYDNVVEFNPQGDEDNPMDWPQSYKRGVIMLLAFMAFTV
jgi:hypothetical protein